MAQLRAGLKDVAREIEFHISQSPLANDKFVPVMREFQATATCRLAEVEDQYQDMKVRKFNCHYTGLEIFLRFFIFRIVLIEPFAFSEKILLTPNLMNFSEFSIPL